MITIEIRERAEAHGEEIQLVREVKCDRCGEWHALDDFAEQAEISYFCDRDKVRIPFPNEAREEILKREQKLRLEELKDDVDFRAGRRKEIFRITIARW
ncbi:MAG: hypothetical protein AB7E55_01360 [Pigmentiphaga sp.]